MSPWMLLLLLIIPIPWIARSLFPHKVKLNEVAITCAVAAGLTLIVYFCGIVGRTSDVEVWNGEITKKARVHGTYEQPYQCMCVQSCSGSGSNQTCTNICQTCYETHYTVHWYANSNIYDFTIDSLDRTSRSVYRAPDPARWTEVQVGDPVSITRSFTNYIKAVPESLFNAHAIDKYKSSLPEYPSRIFDVYKINRVMSVGVPVPDLEQWNRDLSQILKKLGPQKQANAIIVFVKTTDQSYQLALESKWLGGKKNDVIITIGSTNYPKIDWVGVTSWTKKEIFKVRLRDDIIALENIDRGQILSLLNKHTLDSFERRNMSDFKYLEDEIEPPFWVIMLALVLGVLASLGLSFFFYKHET